MNYETIKNYVNNFFTIPVYFKGSEENIDSKPYILVAFEQDFHNELLKTKEITLTFDIIDKDEEAANSHYESVLSCLTTINNNESIYRITQIGENLAVEDDDVILSLTFQIITK